MLAGQGLLRGTVTPIGLRGRWKDGWMICGLRLLDIQRASTGGGEGRGGGGRCRRRHRRLLHRSIFGH